MRQPEVDSHLSRSVPQAPPEEEEGDCPRAQHSPCPCARTHTYTYAHPLSDARPACILHPDRLKKAPAAPWVSRSLQGKEELIRLEAADKRTHGLKRPRPVAQTPALGRCGPSCPHTVPSILEAPQPASNYLQLPAQGIMGGLALIDNCPGPEGLCPPTPAAGHSQLQRRRPGGWLWPVGPVEPGVSPCQCGEGNSINSGVSDAGKDSVRSLR